jgi:diacylglycerol kinase (ATP)
MKSRNLVESFNHAINGLIHAVRSERNMKIHITTAVLVMLLSLFYDLTRLEFLVVCIAVALVIICELFNTAIEVIVNAITDVYHPKAKIIKDVSAGAVLVAAFISLIVAYFIFFDRVRDGLEGEILKIRQAPIHITIISLTITVMAVLTIKAFSKKGTPLRGGLPSGHSAIAFSITTAIALWTDNISVTILCIIISMLLVQSRLEAKIHSLFELAAGAFLGSLITLLLFQLFYR